MTIFKKWLGRNHKLQPRPVPTAKDAIILLMAQIGAAQETYKEELAVVGIKYPLNQAVFCLANALAAIKRKEENIVFRPVVTHKDIPDEKETIEEETTLESLASGA